MSRLVLLAVGLLSIVVAKAGSAQDLQTWGRASEGFRREAILARLPPAETPSRLETASREESLAHLAPALTAELDSFLRPEGTRIIIISKRRKIIYEGYAEKWLRQSTPLGYSMSKSLTALAVGKALCQGAIPTLQQRVDSLLPALQGTSWGGATVEQLLLMQSGSTRQEPARSGWQSEEVAAENRGIYSGRMAGNYFEFMRRHDEHQLPPGREFQYNNYDTLALGLLVEAVTKRPFPEFFNETIWQPAGPQHEGTWLQSSSGQTAVFAGFSASPEDWIRLGHFVIDSMLGQSDCFGRYLAKAVQPAQRTFISTRCYGYQIWNWCSSDNFLFVGYGGQNLVMMPRRGLVMYIHQASDANDGRLMLLYHQQLLKAL